jgi:pyridoxamine 5'-phosphate oxidase
MHQEHQQFLPESLPENPLQMVDEWLTFAQENAQRPNPNSMILATCGQSGMPSSRVVLCKELAIDPGYLVFYTNYESKKGHELASNPKASALFHWDQLGRQVRVEGLVTKSPVAECDQYFSTRPWPAQLGAWASQQSEPIGSLKEMQEQVTRTAKKLGLDLPELEAGGLKPADIPRPEHWGGYRLWVSRVELWIEGAGRVHDRGLWTRDLRETEAGEIETGTWQSTRLQP